MLPIEVIGLFLAAAIVVTITPGPDNLFVLTQSTLHGREAGLITTAGICCGILLHTLAVALGVAVLFQTSALAFTTLKIAGVLYLLFLAWQAFRASSYHSTDQALPAVNRKGLFIRGALMNLTNPKVAIFFLAFLPQFVDPAYGSIILQTSLLGILFMVTTFLIFGGIAFTASSIGTWLKESAEAQKLLHRFSGVLFVGLAIRLATASRNS